jgi:hypothetical protein
MTRPAMKGSIEFRYDAVNDLVIARPRWTLDSSVEVMRWYQMHANYFAGRFKDRKDLIVLQESFDVTPQVATLWGQYRARLHETYIGLSVRVNSNARVLLTTNTSAARYTISALEAASLEEAISAIRGAREARTSERPPSGLRLRPSMELGVSRSTLPPKVNGSKE